MKKRNKIRLFSFAAALLLILSGFIIESQISLNQSKRQLEYAYRRSLNDLTNYISDMEFTLRKASYANTPTMRNELSAELLEMSSGAKAAMAVLPFSQERSEKISLFISQVGDYAMALSRKSASGAEIEDADFQSLETMEEYAVKLSTALNEVQAHVSVQKAEIGRTQRALSLVGTNDIPDFDDSMDEVAKEFAQFPSLLYDGPFSDHIMQQTPKLIENEKEISEQDARQKAAQFFGCNKDQLKDGGTGNNAIPAYIYLYQNARIVISKQGGLVAYYKDSTPVDAAQLSYEQALKSAKDFLAEQGYGSVKESYYLINDNLCTINFSYMSEDGKGIICYPDLLKVVLSLKDGHIAEFDATGYIMNHHARTAEEPKLSLEEAKGNVSTNLKIQSYEMCIIPTPGLSEIYCYEFKCKDGKDTDVLVYINTQTGMEEQIYILTYSDNGVLTF